MSAVLSITPLASMLESYIRAGFALVPIEQGKGPTTKGWNERANCVTQVHQINPYSSYGLAHAYSGTCALDIDSWTESVGLLKTQGVDIEALVHKNDSVMIDSGNPGHAKFLFRTPFGMTLPTRKITQHNNTIFELRCASSNGTTVQDVVPSAALHPKTGQQYRWAGNGHFSALPVLPDALLTYWQSLDAEPMTAINVGEASPADWDDVVSAVHGLPADCTRDEWIKVGMGLHLLGQQTKRVDLAFSLWHEWSATCPDKFPGDREITHQWHSFRPDKASMVTTGTIFRIARQHGWTKPIPDVAALFSSMDAPDAIFADMRPKPPQMDINLWPKVLAGRAAAIGESVGCDPLVPLFAGLAAVCAATDARTRLTLLPGFKVPPVLWLMTIGEPADKKTPGSVPMFTPLRAIEDEDRERFARAMLEWEGKEAAYAAQKKSFLEFAASTDSLMANDARPEVEPLAPQPVPLRFTVKDVTSQKLVRMCADRPAGVLCNLDEMNSWVRKLVDKASGEDRSAWVTAYESAGYEMDRVGSGTIYAENMAVSIYGNIQPRVYKDHIHALTADGLLQRFIPCVLDSDLRHKPKPMRHDQMMTSEWEQLLRLVYSLPPTEYTLSPGAFAAFDAFQDWYELRMAEERLLQSDGTYMTAFGKIEGLCGRLILMFHIIDCPFRSVVSVDTANRAIALVKSYIVPILRYTLSELANVSTFEGWVQEYIIQNCDRTTITLAEIKRSYKNRWAGMSVWQQDQAIMDAMYPLEASRWVMRTDDGANEHRHRAEWAINPALLGGFKDYRVIVVRAKQKRLDEVYQQSTKPKPKVKGHELIDSDNDD